MQPSQRAWAGIWSAALAGALILISPAALLGAARAEGPDLLYSRLPAAEHPDPIWVSAAELGKEGHLDFRLLGQPAAARWQRIEPYLKRLPVSKEGVGEASEEDCTASDVSSWPSPVHPPDDGLLPLIRGAQAAFSGTVVERTLGFFLGAPATLLTIELDEIFKIEPPVQAARRLYLLYPQARFTVAGRVFCGRHQQGAEAPPVGSRLIVLGQNPPLDREGLLLRVNLEELVLEASDGTLVLPPNLKRDDEMLGIKKPDELLAKLRLGFQRLEAPERPVRQSLGTEGLP